ncbi:LPXTG cell wall anchor domain-containing protein [Olsenella uli]|nr:LPXTG cell wall anchor domain-containing protein [Olsenella uli]
MPDTGDATTNAPLFLLGAALPLVAVGAALIFRTRRS